MNYAITTIECIKPLEIHILFSYYLVIVIRKVVGIKNS